MADELGFFDGSYTKYVESRAETEGFKAIAQKLGIEKSNMVDCCSNSIGIQKFLTGSKVESRSTGLYVSLKMYKNKFIEEEMKMNINEYDSLERALRSIGGCVDLEYETIGSTYYCNDPEVTIKLPASMIKYMKVNMPTTDFDKNGCTAKKIEANSIPKVSRVETYNDKVVKVTFSDGTFTKSVCSDNDTFNVDIGITICIMKRMMSKTEGNKKYNDMIRKIHEQMIKNEKEKEEKKAAQIKKKEDNRKVNERKAKKKAAQRAEQIDIQKTAFLEAMREINNVKAQQVQA